MRSVVSSAVKRTRQNHALEHATVHLLARSHPSLRIVGRSHWNGFSLYGPVDSQAVLRCATEGLARLQRDEVELALHPRCGSHLAVSALLGCGVAGVAAAMSGRSLFRRLAGVLLSMVGAVTLARPLGTLAQRHLTTSSDLSGARIEGVRQETKGALVVHHVQVAHDRRAQGDVLHTSR